MPQYLADRVALGSNRAVTQEGYLLCKDVPFARTGFQTYKASEIGLKGDELVKVYRKHDQVLHPATLASFEGKTVTSPHPPQLLDLNNDAMYYKGHIQNVRAGAQLADGEYPLIGDILIKDSRLIEQVKSGALSELSAGYRCEYEADEHSPDIYYQVEIRGNHVAVVPSGRAGKGIKILDSKEEAVAETVAVVDDKVSVGALTGLLRLLGLGSARTVDSESESVKNNEEIAKRGEERAVERNKDKDAEEAEEKKTKEAKDALVSDIKAIVKDAVAEAMKAKDTDEEEKKDKKAEDAEKEIKDELIPTETLSTEERPKNPIPGADKALDALMKIKTNVADHGSKEEKEAWNMAYRALKQNGVRGTSDGYSALATPRRSDATTRAEELASARPALDAASGDDFVAAAEMFRGKNPSEGAAALAASRKGGK